MKLIIILVFLLLYTNSFSQKVPIQFVEKKADTLSIKIDSLLIVGAGSSTTNAFLEDAANHLIKHLQKKGVYASFQFLGKGGAEARKAYEGISKNGYKAVMLFLPDSSLTFDVQGGINIIGTYSPVSIIGRGLETHSRVKYVQEFTAYLCLPEDLKKIWTGDLLVACDITNPVHAKSVAKQTLYFLDRNNYLRSKKK